MTENIPSDLSEEESAPETEDTQSDLDSIQSIDSRLKMKLKNEVKFL